MSQISDTLKQHFAYMSDIVLCACWPVLSHHTFLVVTVTTSYFKLLYKMAACRSGAHTALYPVGAQGSYLAGKVARAWSWPLTSI